MRIIFFYILLFFFSTLSKVMGQSDVKLSSFFLTPLTYNPAYAGSYEGMTFTSLYSSQWVGFEGAPKTIFVNGHGTFFGPNSGFGAEVMHDEIGATVNTKFLGNYAYHIQLNESWKLALGIKAGVSSHTIDYNQLKINNPNEVISFDGEETNINANIGSGLFIHNSNFYFGFGAPNFLKTTYVNSYNNVLAKNRIYYYISSGYSFDLQNEFYFQPSILVRFVEGAPYNILLAGSMQWQEKVYGSINVDLDSTLGGFFGFRFAEKYLFGYAYDTSITRFSNSNGGIHSFFLNIRLEDYWQRERCSCYTF